MEPPSFKLRPASALSVPYFALGLVDFLLINAAIAVGPGAVNWPLGSRGIFLLHLTVLGWVTPVMMGADYQLVPVVLHRPIRGRHLAVLIFGLYTLGVAAFLAGWATSRTPWIAAGGAAVGFALMVFCVHVGASLASVRRGIPVAVGLVGGIVFLAVTSVLGAWMAMSIGGSVPAPAFGVLRAMHAAAGLNGWVLLTIMGATYQLVPFFAATPPAIRVPFGASAVYLAGVGALLILAAGLTSGRLPAVAGLITTAVGSAMWLFDLGYLARHGRQAWREPVVAFSLAAAAAILLGGTAAAAAWGAGNVRLGLAAAALGLLAGPSLLILGQLQRILPFLAALDSAGATKRSGPAPKTDALFPRRRAYLLLAVLAPGFVAECAGLAVAAPQAVRLGAVLVLAAALAHGWQQARALAVWARARG